MKRLLVTAFTPFGGETVNASALALDGLPDRIGDWRLQKQVLPVVFGRAAEEAIAAAEAVGAEGILCLGQAAGRRSITPELIAVNLQYARIPDNAGGSPKDSAVVPGGPAAYFSTLPARKMAEAVAAAGIPAALSYSAGAFVCNDLYYRILHHFDGSPVRAVFVHIPVTPSQGTPCMDTETAVRGLTGMIKEMGESR